MTAAVDQTVGCKPVVEDSLAGNTAAAAAAEVAAGVVAAAAEVAVAGDTTAPVGFDVDVVVGRHLRRKSSEHCARTDHLPSLLHASVTEVEKVAGEASWPAFVEIAALGPVVETGSWGPSCLSMAPGCATKFANSVFTEKPGRHEYHQRRCAGSERTQKQKYVRHVYDRLSNRSTKFIPS